MNRKIMSIGKGSKLDLSAFNKIVHEKVKVKLSPKAKIKIKQSHLRLKKIVNSRNLIYGLNTQFGNQVNLIDKSIKENPETYLNSVNLRQKKLIRSHAIGLGEEIPGEVVRGGMLLRAHCLAQGYSGVRSEVIEKILEFLNKDIEPIVKRYGSIGASGDLIPLSMIASALVGEAKEVIYKGKRMPLLEAFKKGNVKPLTDIQLRDGLALVNGTSVVTSYTIFALFELKRIYSQLLQTLAITLEVLRVSDSGYNIEYHKLKNHEGETEIARFMLSWWKGSKLIRTQKNIDENSDVPLQDYYSLRSICQGFGVLHETLKLAERWVTEEMNSVNDNPVIDEKNNGLFHGAHFMGYHITESCDILKMDIAQASTWIHALIAILVHPRKSYGLPVNLVQDPYIDNGFRPVQILVASITIQNRKLAQSQQAFMLPTEGDNQDVNSLAFHAARDFTEAVENLERLTAILLFSSLQAVDLRGKDKVSPKTLAVHNKIRKTVPFLKEDRDMSKDIEVIIHLLKKNII